MSDHTAILFPGQGSYLPGVLANAADHPGVRPVLEEIDRTVAEYGHTAVSPLVLSSDAADLDALVSRPSELSLAIFAASLGAYELFKAAEVPGDVLVGHSIGEITALAAAGAVSVRDATRMLCWRHQLLDSAALPEGGMLAVKAGAQRVVHLTGTVDDWSLSIAADNSPHEAVVSGSERGLRGLEQVAEAAGLRTTRLASAYPFHNPVFAPVAKRLTEVLDTIVDHDPWPRIYSPMLGRYLAGPQDVRELYAGHLHRPVNFLQATRALSDRGISVFVEGGPRQALTTLVGQTLPGVRSLAPLSRRTSATDIIEQIRTTAETTTWNTEPSGDNVSPPPPEQPPAPETPAADPGASTNGIPAESNSASLPPRQDLAAQLRQLFAESVGYPTDVFTEDADLEADLGISSVKQVELFTKVLDQYGVPNPPNNIRMRAYSTLPRLAELLHLLAAGEPVESR
ncbi:Malonyl CoA-acyl carrier protein transacylase [Actinopolyspora alba]|uniref:[acyl-carrier-protein] S-malonyltransferase n=1 Tax=Actinopolyspora alba TaxID=673379 RepID=A0A1I1WVT6_9ACTN|nr:acyltransferase domain-containing protein [Actinopolyspora alba]SFD99226.1 Malonyl CoA-acyl carrier protein transacylase [Actinopolyspora alba]